MEKLEENLANRLQELQEEYNKGKKNLSELEKQSNSLRDTLLRISGAIQVIQEELHKADQKENPINKTQPASIVQLP